MSTVNIPVDRGGSGTTWSDARGDANTMRGGGYKTRMLPMISDVLGAANFVKDTADDAVADADRAEAAAATAVNAPGTSATSTTSHNITVGAKTFTIQTGKSIALGARVVGARTSSPANAVYAYVAGYNSGTGQFDIVVDKVAGSGTAVTDWTFSISGAIGATGASGATPTTIVYKTANESVSSSTTYQDDNELLFPVVSGTTYRAKFVISASPGLNADIKLRFNGPTTSAMKSAFQMIAAFGYAGYQAGKYTSDANPNNHTFTDDTANDGNNALFFCVVEFTATSTANFVLQWAQRASSANASSVQQGSYVEWGIV